MRALSLVALGAELLVVTIGCTRCPPNRIEHRIRPTSEVPARRTTPPPPTVRSDATTAPPRGEGDEHLEHAMRGISYSAAFATVDTEIAAEIVPHPDPSQSLPEEREGRRRLEAGDQLDAIQAFTRAAIHDPANSGAYDGLGACLMDFGRFRDVCATTRTAIALDSDSIASRARLAQAAQSTGEFDEAVRQWREVLARNPGFPSAHGRLAVLLYYAEDYAGAWEHLHAAEEACERHPGQLRQLLLEQMPEPPESSMDDDCRA